MSVVGTGVAAGVAQTSLQAQQVSRRRDKDHAQRTSNSGKMREVFEAHLRALEEGDEIDSGDRLYIDGEVPQGESSEKQPPQEILKKNKDGHLQEHTPQATPDTPDTPEHPSDTAPSTAAVVEPKDTLYRHVDVKA